MKKSPSLRLPLILIVLALSLAGVAGAQEGRGLALVESPPLDLDALTQAAPAKAAPALGLREVAPAGEVLAPVSEAVPTKQSGCRAEPSSPAIGADIPQNYFGVPGPTSNPSLVGARQLLTSGPLDPIARTITLPLYRGTIQGTGQRVWYIATDTTDVVNAEALGLNHSAKLAFAEVGRGVRNAYLVGDELEFEKGTVDFTPDHRVVPGPSSSPFPPVEFQPGSEGDEDYTPLAKIVNAGGHIYDLPIIGVGPARDLTLSDGSPNYKNVHDKVVQIRPRAGTVTIALTAGFSFGRPVLYISTEANNPLPASLEGATYAPGLEDIDTGNDDGLFSAVERLFAFINGPRGCDNPHRQGFEAALTDGETPFNVLGGIPTVAPDYSPLWDLNVGEWTQEAIDAGYRARMIDEFQVLSFVEFGFVTGPGGAPYGSSGFIVNCPIVHRFL